MAKFFGLCAVLVVLYFLFRDWDISLASLRDQVGAYPLGIAVFVFAGLYCFISVVPIAGRDIFKLVAAMLWGWWLSTLIVFAGEMLAALVAFVLARVLGKDLLDQLFGDRLKSSYQRLNRAGVRNVILLRILPITPYRYFNYTAGVTDLDLAPYLVGSAVGIFIRTLFFQTLFSLFANQLIERGVTLPQILLFSLLLTAVMFFFWILYNRKSPKTDNQPKLPES